MLSRKQKKHGFDIYVEL